MFNGVLDDLLDPAVGNSSILGNLVISSSFLEGGQEGFGFPLTLFELRSELLVHALFNGEIGHLADLLVSRAVCCGREDAVCDRA